MTGFLTHNPNIEPENKEYIEPKEQTTSKKQTAENKPIERSIPIEPKPKKKSSLFKKIIVILILLLILEAIFLGYSSYKKGKLNSESLSLDNLKKGITTFLNNKKGNSDQNNITINTDNNSDQNGLIDSNS